MNNDPKEKLLKLIVTGMKRRGVEDDPMYKSFLKAELQDLNVQNDHQYFVAIHEKGIKFPYNENNLIIPWLLGIVDDFNISLESSYHPFEFPDIDVDYLPVVQDYLRNVWCPLTFGREFVCNIGNYTTFGIKSAFLDMARVHGVDKAEIQEITKHLQDKDDDGKPVTFEKALELTPELAKYCEEHPDVADAARRLVGRNRGRGKHAGGTVISSKRIDDLVPIMVDTDGNPVSGWTEGLHDQDLAPVGLIKFDVLAIKDLLRIAGICELIKVRNPEYRDKGISAIEGESDWTDLDYLNDSKSISLANEAKLRGIFQFDGKGIRQLVKQGGVDSFEDLVAYTALFRPGPLGMGMQEKFIARKHGRENWRKEMPECMLTVLENTYGVMVYQEQVMKILNIVGEIPLVQCEQVRKAISKKKEEKFAKYKQMFLENGSAKIGWSIHPKVDGDTQCMQYLWDQIVSFAEYGFNKSHAVAYTYISARLLYLKAHFPLEFFTVTLGLEDDADKLRGFKREAEHMGIEVCRTDLNKSGVNFEITDGKIYVGFQKIKGIGEAVARKIVEGQPYSGFVDFLERFGTDKRIIDPLIALSTTGGIFTEDSPEVLEEFYELYKKRVKQYKDREKRHMKRREELIGSIKSLMPDDLAHLVTHEWVMQCYLDRSFFEQPDIATKEVWNLIIKYGKSVASYEQKVALDNANPVTFENFEPLGAVDPEKFRNPFNLERQYYGFSWEHPLQKSPNYSGDMGFSQFEDEHIIVTPVEVVVRKQPKEKISKKGNKYYYVVVEDEDWNMEVITFWEDDFERFREELEYWDEKSDRGNLLKLRLERPGPGFKSYTFDSPPKHLRHKKIPKEKENDYRLDVLAPPSNTTDPLDSLRQL